MQITLYILGFIVLVFGAIVFRGAPYLPAHKSAVNSALKLIKRLGLAQDELVIDLGSGDGKFLVAASKAGHRVVGYELNPILVFITKFRLRSTKNAVVKNKDFWNIQFPKNTKVVYVFLLDKFMDKLDKKMQSEANRLGTALYLASYTFKVPNKKPAKALGGVRMYRYIAAK